MKELEQSICLVLHLEETLLLINTHFRPEIEVILPGSIRNQMHKNANVIKFSQSLLLPYPRVEKFVQLAFLVYCL